MRYITRILCGIVFVIISLTASNQSYALAFNTSAIEATAVENVYTDAADGSDADNSAVGTNTRAARDKDSFYVDMRSWVSHNFNILLFFLFVGAGLWVFSLLKFISPQINLILIGSATLLYNVCAMFLTYSVFGKDAAGLSFAYIGNIILLIPMLLGSVASICGFTILCSKLCDLTESRAMLFLKVILGGALLCGVVSVIEMLVEGISGKTDMDMRFTTILISVYALAMVGIGIFYGITGSKAGNPRLAVFGGTVAALSAVCLGVSVMLFCIYILFLVAIAVVVMIIGGIKGGMDGTPHLVDQYGRKVYGNFESNDVFRAVGGQQFKRNLRGDFEGPF